MSLNGQNNTQNLLQSYLNRLQELEDAIWFLLSSMSINAAFGALLDKIGSIVGEARLGRADADYQAGIRIAIRVNISQGRATDIIAIAQLASPNNTPRYIEPPGVPSCGAAAFVIDFTNLASAQYVAGKLSLARAAGTYGIVSFTVIAGPVLILDSVSGGVANAGLMDSVSGGVVSPGLMSAGLGI